MGLKGGTISIVYCGTNSHYMQSFVVRLVFPPEADSGLFVVSVDHRGSPALTDQRERATEEVDKTAVFVLDSILIFIYVLVDKTTNTIPFKNTNNHSLKHFHTVTLVLSPKFLLSAASR